MKLAEYEYGVVQSEADFYISLTELNKAIGVPGYFRPVYETQGLETTTISSLEEVKSGK